MFFLKLFLVALLVLMSIDCAAHSKCYYNDETRNMALQKMGANISLNAGLGEYKDTLRERTMVKYQKLPVYGDSVNGFEGVLYNEGSVRANIIIRGRDGIERPAISLDAGDKIYVRLMPDTYDYKIYSKCLGYGRYGETERLTGCGILHVGVKINPITIKGEEILRHFWIVSTYNGY